MLPRQRVGVCAMLVEEIKRFCNAALRASVVRPTEAYISYLMFSINETPVILRMVNDHPYGNVRFASHFSLIIRKCIGRSIPRRRRLPLCHFVTSPQRGAPLPYMAFLLLCTKRNHDARVRYVINAVPYREFDLLRILH